MNVNRFKSNDKINEIRNDKISLNNTLGATFKNYNYRPINNHTNSSTTLKKSINLNSNNQTVESGKKNFEGNSNFLSKLNDDQISDRIINFSSKSNIGNISIVKQIKENNIPTSLKETKDNKESKEKIKFEKTISSTSKILNQMEVQLNNQFQKMNSYINSLPSNLKDVKNQLTVFNRDNLKNNIVQVNCIYGIINSDKLASFNPQQNINIVNEDKVTKQILIEPSHHVYDETFVGIINNLSQKIKSTNKLHYSSLEQINELPKKLIEITNEIKLSIGQIGNYNISNSGKYSQRTNSEKIEKTNKEKISYINDQLDKVIEVGINVKAIAAQIERNNSDFFNTAKDFIREMKKIRNDKIEEIKTKISEMNNFMEFKDMEDLKENQNKINEKTLESNMKVVIESLKEENNKLKIDNQNLLNQLKLKSEEIRKQSVEKIKNMTIISKDKTSYIQSENNTNLGLFKGVGNYKENSNSEINTPVKRDFLSSNRENSDKNEKKFINKLNITVVKTQSQDSFSKNDSSSNNTVNLLVNEKNPVKINFKSIKTNENYLNNYINNNNSNNIKSKPEIVLNSENKIEEMNNDVETVQKVETKVIKLQNNQDLKTNPNLTNNNVSLLKISAMVIDFMKNLTNLQMAISNKSENTQELKKLFEIKKKELQNVSKMVHETELNKMKNKANNDKNSIYSITNCDSFEYNIKLQSKSIANIKIDSNTKITYMAIQPIVKLEEVKENHIKIKLDEFTNLMDLYYYFVNTTKLSIEIFDSVYEDLSKNIDKNNEEKYIFNKYEKKEDLKNYLNLLKIRDISKNSDLNSVLELKKDYLNFSIDESIIEHYINNKNGITNLFTKLNDILLLDTKQINELKSEIDKLKLEIKSLINNNNLTITTLKEDNDANLTKTLNEKQQEHDYQIKLSKIDCENKLISLENDLINKFQLEKQEIRKNLNTKITELQNEKTLFQSNLEKSKNDLVSLNKTIKENNTKIDELQNEIEKLNISQLEIIKHNDQLKEDLIKKNEDLKFKDGKISEISEKYNKKCLAYQELMFNIEKNKSNESQNMELFQTINSLRKEIEDFSVEKTNLERRNEEIINSNKLKENEMQKEIESNKIELNRIKKSEQDIKEKNSKNEELKVDLEKNLNLIKQNLLDRENDLTKLKQLNSSLELKLSEVSGQHQIEKEILNNKYDVLKVNNEKLQLEKINIEKELQKLKSESKIESEKLQKIISDSQKNYSEKINELELINSENIKKINILEHEIKENKSNELKYESNKTKLTEFEEKYTRIHQEYDNLEKKYVELLNQNKSYLSEINLLKETIDSLNQKEICQNKIGSNLEIFSDDKLVHCKEDFHYYIGELKLVINDNKSNNLYEAKSNENNSDKDQILNNSNFSNNNNKNKEDLSERIIENTYSSNNDVKCEINQVISLTILSMIGIDSSPDKVKLEDLRKECIELKNKNKKLFDEISEMNLIHDNLIDKLSNKDFELENCRHQLEKANKQKSALSQSLGKNMNILNNDKKKADSVEKNSNLNENSNINNNSNSLVSIPIDIYKKSLEKIIKEETKSSNIQYKYDKLKKEYDAIKLQLDSKLILKKKKIHRK